MKKISARLGILCLLTFSLLFAGCSAGSSTQKRGARRRPADSRRRRSTRRRS